MTRTLSWLGLFVFVAFAGFLAYGWRASLRKTDESVCYACQRPIHPNMKTVATVGGKRKTFCCPACALSARRQGTGTIEITQVTDYLTGARLRPDEAYFIQDSDVNPCLSHQPLVDQSKSPMGVYFDRCTPSLLAFQNSTSALEFASKHGGHLVRFGELAGP